MDRTTRRRAQCVSLLTAAALLAAAGLAGCGSTSHVDSSATLPCAARPDGALCIKLIADHATVRDVIAYLSSSGSPLVGKRWRLTLGRYACDPGTSTRPNCAALAVYPGPTRHGPPPVSTSCRTSSGTVVTAPTGCHDTLAQETGTLGAWAGFYRLGEGKPKTFASRTWLCVSEETEAGGSWRLSSAPLPLRACAAVPAS
jgi:hypothetical protein